MEENPYKSPAGLQRRPTVGKAILVVAICAVAGALIGTSAGYILRRFAPYYYRSVFLQGDAPGFDPVQVGIGLGLTQGMALGFLAGVIIMIVVMRRKKPPA